MPTIKPKRRKKVVHKVPESRDNYKKWPTTSFLVTGLACGTIFFLASNITRIDESTGVSLALQIGFLGLSILTFFPSLLVLFFFAWYCILRALEIKIPKWIFRKIPILKRFHKEAKRQSSEDSFLERENKRRVCYGDTMLELESSQESSDSDYYDDDEDEEDEEGTGSEIWTTHNHQHKDRQYVYTEGGGAGDERSGVTHDIALVHGSPPSSRDSTMTKGGGAHHQQQHRPPPPQIIVEAPPTPDSLEEGEAVR